MPIEITMPLPIADADSTAVRRERDRLRKAAARRAQGMRSQAERRTTKDLAALAAVAGVTLRTIFHHRRAGTLATFLDERGLSSICPPEWFSSSSAHDGVGLHKSVRDDVSPYPGTYADTLMKLRDGADDALAEFAAIDPIFGDPWPWLPQPPGPASA